MLQVRESRLRSKPLPTPDRPTATRATHSRERGHALSGRSGSPMNQHPSQSQTPLHALALGALGVVYGDIGTSPLYTMKEVFGGHHPLPPTPEKCILILDSCLTS